MTLLDATLVLDTRAQNVTLGWRRLAVTKDDGQQGNKHTRSASKVTGEPQYLLTRFRHVAARKQSNGGYLRPRGFGQVPKEIDTQRRSDWCIGEESTSTSVLVRFRPT